MLKLKFCLNWSKLDFFKEKNNISFFNISLETEYSKRQYLLKIYSGKKSRLTRSVEAPYLNLEQELT